MQTPTQEPMTPSPFHTPLQEQVETILGYHSHRASTACDELWYRLPEDIDALADLCKTPREHTLADLAAAMMRRMYWQSTRSLEIDCSQLRRQLTELCSVVEHSPEQRMISDGAIRKHDAEIERLTALLRA